jgi:hypothetical protein
MKWTHTAVCTLRVMPQKHNKERHKSRLTKKRKKKRKKGEKLAGRPIRFNSRFFCNFSSCLLSLSEMLTSQRVFSVNNQTRNGGRKTKNEKDGAKWKS